MAGWHSNWHWIIQSVFLGIVSMGTGGAKQTAALKAHANPVLTEEGIKKTLSMFVVNKDLITDELVKVRFASATNDYASNRLMDVVGARDRDRFEFPLDFDKMKDITVPVLVDSRYTRCGDSSIAYMGYFKYCAKCRCTHFQPMWSLVTG